MKKLWRPLLLIALIAFAVLQGEVFVRFYGGVVYIFSNGSEQSVQWWKDIFTIRGVTMMVLPVVLLGILRPIPERRQALLVIIAAVGFALIVPIYMLVLSTGAAVCISSVWFFENRRGFDAAVVFGATAGIRIGAYMENPVAMSAAVAAIIAIALIVPAVLSSMAKEAWAKRRNQRTLPLFGEGVAQ